MRQATIWTLISLVASFWVPFFVLWLVIGAYWWLALTLAFVCLAWTFDELVTYERRNPRG